MSRPVDPLDEAPGRTPAAHPPPRERWGAPDAGARYAGERWRNRRRAARDPRLVERLLARAGVRDATILDAPCGAGRLLPGLVPRARRAVGLDASASMLGEAAGAGAPLVRGDVARLPFRAGSFDAVVCCRLLHHLAGEAELAAAVGELVRVSRGVVVASFWDAGSFAAWRRRRTRPDARRVARKKDEIAAHFAAAGARVVAYAHGLRFVSQQSFLLAEVAGAARR